MEQQVQELTMAIELFKAYGFQPKQFETLMAEIKKRPTVQEQQPDRQAVLQA